MKRLTIRLKQEWKNEGSSKSYKAGTILEMDRDKALDLVDEGVATLYASEIDENVKEVSDVKGDGPDITEAIEREIKKALKEAAPAAKAQSEDLKAKVEVGKNLIEDDPKLGWKSFGHFIQDVVKVGDATKDLNRAANVEGFKAVSGHSEGIDSDGGFLVPVEFLNQLLEKVYDSSLVTGRAFNIPMGSAYVEIPYIDETSRANGSRSGSIQAYWLSEGTAHTVEGVKFGKVRLNAHKLVGAAAFTEELIQDSVQSIEALVNRALVNELSFVLDNALIRGTGQGQPQGVLNANCLLTIAAETGQAASTILFENVLNMWARLWARSRPNAVWYVNQDIMPQLLQMQIGLGTSAQPVFLPPGGVSGSQFGTLFGRPVIEIEQCSTLGTVGDIILADMSQYLYGTRGGVQSAQSMHFRFDVGETVLRVSTRVDGQPWWSSALTPTNGSNTQSPFLALATRS